MSPPATTGDRRALVVVSAGLRQPSTTRLLADRLAEATVVALAGLGVDTTVRVVELREHSHDMVNMLATGFASEALQAAIDSMVGADGLIAVTPIFSGSYTGPFKTFFDILDDGALAGMPVLLGATAGTARHSLAIDHAMRPLFAYLRTLVIPTGVFGATEDFGAATRPRVGSTDGSVDAVPPIAVRISRAAHELASLLATQEPRAGTGVLAEPTPFERLLAGEG